MTDTYTYPTNPTGGRNPKLHSIAFGAGGTHTFSYDAAGNTTQVYKSDEVLQLVYDGASRLSTLRSIPEDARAHFAYDGRSFLRRAEGDVDQCHPGMTVPTYDSAGLLRGREHRNLFTPAAPPQDSETVLYFAGRPVAILRLTPSTSDLKFLTTDHLGTPILATADTGALVWQGGFEPFGADWSGAGAAGVFLRFPGQWVDGLWEGGRVSSGLYYNVHRWYGWGTGRYEQIDPLGAIQPIDHFLYARGNPIAATDPLGLFVVDPSCDCYDRSDKQHPGNQLGGTITRACSYLKRPGCREALRSRGMEDCFQKRCGGPLFAGGTRIVCNNSTEACGQTWPNGTITLYRGNSTCPRIFEGREKGPTGPRDFSQTLFHEIGHTCGVGAEEPNWWKDLQTVCTGWPL